MDRESWSAAVHGVAESDMAVSLDWTEISAAICNLNNFMKCCLCFDIVPLIRIFPKDVGITENLILLSFYLRQYWGILMLTPNCLVATIKKSLIFHCKNIHAFPNSLYYTNSGPSLIWLSGFITCDNMSFLITFSEKGMNWIKNNVN